jgi:hypothetical protein
MTGKANSFPGQLVQVGRGKLLLPVTGQVPIAQVIGQDVNDVGRGRRF